MLKIFQQNLNFDFRFFSKTSQRPGKVPATPSRHFRALLGQKHRVLQKLSICGHQEHFAQHLSNRYFFAFFKNFEKMILSQVLKVCAWCPQILVGVVGASSDVT